MFSEYSYVIQVLYHRLMIICSLLLYYIFLMGAMVRGWKRRGGSGESGARKPDYFNSLVALAAACGIGS
jgi:hypothetical protein